MMHEKRQIFGRASLVKVFCHNGCGEAILLGISNKPIVAFISRIAMTNANIWHLNLARMLVGQ